MTTTCIQKQQTFLVPMYGIDYVVQITDYLNHRTQDFNSFCRV